MPKHHKHHPNAQSETASVSRPDCPAFSFEFLTDQSEYNFNYFGHDKSAAREAKAELVDKMEVLSSIDWKDIDLLNKKSGFELIPSSEIKINLDKVTIKKPEKLYVFRFDKETFRLIGFKEKNDPVFYIVGFDFNYDAYNHGS